MNKLINDTECIAEWQMFLKMFKAIDHTDKKNAPKEYEDLKELIKNSAVLTQAQTSALIYRCDNYEEYHAVKFFNPQKS